MVNVMTLWLRESEKNGFSVIKKVLVNNIGQKTASKKKKYIYIRGKENGIYSVPNTNSMIKGVSKECKERVTKKRETVRPLISYQQSEKES